MVWPAGWGSTPREIDTYVSNIDLAPTFCTLGGCKLGPYPSGQVGPDGRSLVSLLSHGTPLARDALLETAPLGDESKGMPGWIAVRTTPRSGLGLWHYVQYADGERELYDLVNDPYELDNVAGDPTHAAVRSSLARRLTGLLGEGRINRPDLSLWGQAEKFYAGYNLFASESTPSQTLTRDVLLGKTYKFHIQLHNSKLSTDSFAVRASVNSGRIHLTWLLDGVDVTSQMASNGVQLNAVAGSTTRTLTLKVKIKRRFRRGYQAAIEIDAQSIGDPTQDDHVTLVVRR
jgi:hypothetical protein